MGKVLSTICKISAPLASVSNPLVGVVLSSTAAISNIIQADRTRKKINTCIDYHFDLQKQEGILAEEIKLNNYLQEISAIYNEHYGYLSEKKEFMEEYFLFVKRELMQEKMVIENLAEVLDLLDLCAKGGGVELIEKLSKFTEQITTLLHWGLMHIVILAGNESSYQYIADLTENVLDCLELDHLGHSMLEYAYLLGDLRLIQKLKNTQRTLEQNRKIKLAERVFSERKIMNIGSFPFKESDILRCFSAKEDHLVDALITLNKIPTEPEEVLHLMQTLFCGEKHQLLEKMLPLRMQFITLEFIEQLEKLFPSPRSYSKEYSITRIKTFFWLHNNNFSNQYQMHPLTQESPLEFAVTKGSYNDVLNLLICKSNPEQINLVGENLLDFAIRYENTSIVEYLIQQHKMDPFAFNLQGVNPIMLLQLKKSSFTNVLAYIENYYLKPGSDFYLNNNIPSGSNVQTSSMITFAGEYYNLWRKGQRSTAQARIPIVLGLYLSGLKSILPWGENELPWLAKKLGLKVKFHNGEEYNFNDMQAQEIRVKKTNNGYVAEWEGETLEVFEPDIQYIDPYNYDLSLIDNINVHNIEQYVDSMYIMLRNVLLKDQQLFEFNLDAWLANSYAVALRIDELPESEPFHPKLFHLSNQFNYYYEIPEQDAGYQAMGVSRITFTKLLLNHLTDPEILQFIRVEWVNWVLSFSHLPQELMKIENLVTNFNKYVAIKHQYQQEPNQNNLTALNTVIANIYDLSNKEYCLNYVAKVIAVPHNYLNPLKYYPATGYLPLGGSLIALAKLIKLNVKIWKIIEHLDNTSSLECIFTYQVSEPRNNIDLWQRLGSGSDLNKVCILSTTDQLNLRSIATHVNLFPADPNSDLSAILHGWFCFLSEATAVVPQNDLLSLLVQVKMKLEDLSVDDDLLEKIKQCRHNFTKELSELFFTKFKENTLFSSNWFNIAEQRVRELARTKLLQEHCKLIKDYKEHLDCLQKTSNLIVEEKLKHLEMENSAFFLNLDKSFTELKIWYNKEQEQAISQKHNNCLAIHNAINYRAQIEHAKVKQRSKKSIRNIAIDLLMDYVISALPKPQNLSKLILSEVGVKVVSSSLKQEKINIKKNLFVSCSKLVFKTDLTENIFNNMFKQFGENLITGILDHQGCKKILHNSLVQGVHSIFNFALNHHVKFSDRYIQAIVNAGVDGIFNGLKDGKLSIDNLLLNITSELANSINKHKGSEINLQLNMSKQSNMLKERTRDHTTRATISALNPNNTIPIMEQNLAQDLIDLEKQSITDKYHLQNFKANNRKKFPKVAKFFDECIASEMWVNSKLKTFKEDSQEKIKQLNSQVERNLNSLDLSVSQKLILNLKKVGLKSVSIGVDTFPGSSNELRKKVLGAVLTSELYFMYKLGEEFKIPNTSIRIAPFGNRTGHPLGRFPHYHKRVPDPKDPTQSLPGQGIGRHRPWE